MVELEQLNIHSSRDIIARHGLTLPELFALSLEFYKEEKHQFNLSYDQKNQLAAYWRQSTLGPFHPDKLNPGYFDFVGNDRKKAWEALGEISANGAMAGFCNLLETVCPDLVPWIRHKKRERENKIIEKKKEEEAKKKKDLEEQMEASKLINIVRKAEELTKQKEQDNSSDEDEEMPGLEKNDRNVHCSPPAPPISASTPPTSTPTTDLTPSTTEVTPAANNLSEQNGAPLAVVEPTKCPELLLPETTNGNVTKIAENDKDVSDCNTETVNGHVNSVLESETVVETEEKESIQTVSETEVNEAELPSQDIDVDSVEVTSEHLSKEIETRTKPVTEAEVVSLQAHSESLNAPEPAVDLKTSDEVDGQAKSVVLIEADSPSTLDTEVKVQESPSEASIDPIVESEPATKAKVNDEIVKDMVSDVVAEAEDNVKDEIVKDMVSGVVAEAESEVAEEVKVEAAEATAAQKAESEAQLVEAEPVIAIQETVTEPVEADSKISPQETEKKSEPTEAPTTKQTADTTPSTEVTPDTLNTILAQHFACVMYLKQMKEAGHELTPEQDAYLVQMAAYDDQLKSLKSRLVKASSTETDQLPKTVQQEVEVKQESAASVEAAQVETAPAESAQGETASAELSSIERIEGDSSKIPPEISTLDSELDKDVLPVPSRSGTNSQESFSMISSGESLQVISSDEACKEPEGTVVENAEVILTAELQESEAKDDGHVEVGIDAVAETSEVLPEPDKEPSIVTVTDSVIDTVTDITVTDNVTDTVTETVTSDVLEMTAPPLPLTLERSSSSPGDVTEVSQPHQAPQPDLAKPNNAAELSALAETLQNQLPDVEATSPVVDTDDESDGEVRMWSKTGVDLFIAEVSRDADSILSVGRGETVTVRIPTYESGTALYWEFATQNYDIGFGASFEWEEEGTGEKGAPELKVRREPILPILRRSSHEKVITGSHAFPRGGTYLLMFDNSFSLLRSKTVYYRVFYTR